MTKILSSFLYFLPFAVFAARHGTKSSENGWLYALIVLGIIIGLLIILPICVIFQENRELKEKLYSKTNPFQMEIQNIRNDAEREIQNIRNDAKREIAIKEKEVRFRISLYSMSEHNKTQKEMNENIKRIEQYFLQIKNRQKYLDELENALEQREKELDDKDIIKQRETALKEKQEQFNDIIEQRETALKEKQENIYQQKSALELQKNLFNEVITKNSVNSYPPFAKAISEYLTRKQKAYEEYLRTKPHPAHRKADILSETTQKLKTYIQKYQEVLYLLDSYEALFPWIEEYREYDPNEIAQEKSFSNHNEDPVRNYIPDIEYEKMTPCERNQKALERYRESHKSNVQIGRLYERYIGYEYESKGYDISYYGALYGLEDLGRDLIAKKKGEILIIQCKYWSKEKQIRENAICQLYGTTIKYRLDHPGEKKIKAVMVTSTICSDVAHKFAEFLGVKIIEKKTYKDYPMIKCNIGKDREKIYHLPFDQQYDKIKIEPNKGEFYAETCMEAELNSFRRAWRWRGG